MMTDKKAIIEWVTKDQGGREKPPGGGTPFYSTVMRFVDEPWPPVNGSWSLVVIKNVEASTVFRWVADVHFLVNEAPHNSLRKGRAFELYEGKKCVARGMIM